MFKGKVIRNDSLDPNYKVEFSYHSENFEIVQGEAFFSRKSPAPKVVFNDYTDYILEKHSVGDSTKKSLELEIGKTVFEHIVSVAKDTENVSPIKSYLSSQAAEEKAEEENRRIYLSGRNKNHFK